MSNKISYTNKKIKQRRISTHQVLLKLKSLQYRLRLAEDIPELEREVIDLCDQYNTDILCGYRITVENGRVQLEKLPDTCKQLEMTFKYDKSRNLEEMIKCFKVKKIRSYFDSKYHGCFIRLKMERNHFYSFLPRYLNSPADVYNFMKSLGKEDRERFISIYLDVKNAVTGVDEVSVGTISSSIVHPREVFKGAIIANSSGIVLVHNHPSGDPEPSKEDKEMTKRLKRVSEIIDIEVLDHVVIGNGQYVSFKQTGLL